MDPTDDLTTAPLDPAAILNALQFSPPVAAPVPVTGGWDAVLWRFRTADGSEHVLRLYPPEQASRVAHELEVIKAAERGGIPVASVETLGSWQDRPALVLRWVSGGTLADAMQRRPYAIPALAADFARLQVRINALAAPAVLRDEAPDSWLRPAEVDDPPLIERLRALPLGTDRLVHLDYHPLNVIVRDREIAAVIDWTNGAAGDPRADFARTAAILHTAPVPGPRAIRPVLRIALRLFRRGWARTYLREAGPLPDLAPFMAWAGTRLARDTERRLGKKGIWAQEADVATMWGWVDRWRERAGLPRR